MRRERLAHLSRSMGRYHFHYCEGQKEVKDARGSKVLTSKIPLTAFREWLSVTTHVNSPMEKIQTPYGTLIFDDCHRNKMYLRGLLLPKATSSRHLYMYKYDFPEDKTNRDRAGLKSNGQKEQMIAKIWSFAIRTPDFMELYCALLLALEGSRRADVFCAEDELKSEDILRIWGFLQMDGKSRDLFYYCEGKGQEVNCLEVFGDDQC